MNPIILSQANRIANGDPDVMQNILAWNFQNCAGANARGKMLSIGEQVNFMKHRAGEFRSGVRRDFGHGGYHASQDLFNKKLYHSGEVEIFHFHYSDEAEHSEDINNGKGEISAFTSIKDVEAACIFQVDFEEFLGRLSEKERNIFLKRLEGYTMAEIANDVKLDVATVRNWLKTVGRKFIDWFGIPGAERFGLA